MSSKSTEISKPTGKTLSEITHGDRFMGFVAGIFSGTAKLLTGHPLDTIKVRMQSEGGFGQFRGPLHCLMVTIRKEGFLALYKGATPPLFGWALMDSVQYGSLANIRWVLQKRHPAGGKLTVVDHAIAGMFAGIIVSFVATPIELLKARLQVQYADPKTKLYSGPIDCAKQLVFSGQVVSRNKT
ncbi:hypothetical protein HK098_004635 [Nowakowskiella sp. JEL0407]|nr:hypothetical protein HK098_004635 [Nowakowskiella sp. JEL0407]